MNRLFLALAALLVSVGMALGQRLPLVEFVTPHGISVTLMPSAVQDTVAIALAFDCGTACDDPKGPATGTIAPAMFLAGADGKTSSELYESFQDFGGDLNFSSTPDQIYASVSAPSAGIEGAVKLVNLVFRKPDFPEKRFLKMRESSARQAEEAASYPEFRAQKAFLQAGIGDHVYVEALNTSPDRIRAVQRADLFVWQKRHLMLKNIIVTVVGKVDQAKAGLLVDTLLDGLPASTDLPPVPAVTFKQGGADPIAVAGDQNNQAYVIAGSIFPRAPALSDWMAGLMLNSIFSGDQKSRLFKDLREATGATYGMQPSINYLEAMELNYVSGRVSKDGLEKTLAIIAKSWAKFRTDGPTPEEVQNAKVNQINAISILARNHLGAANTLRDYRTGHWTTDQIASIPDVIASVNLNDPAVLNRYFSQNPIVVVAQ
ncbi:MAG: insulinase family protein [Alphaproteobacteria bacterium]|nr:insulinase family protein [Alphaproteobacteria bacterium]